MEEGIQELLVHLDIVEQALATLEEALALPLTPIVRDAAIQRFEYTFELGWKLFRKVARVEGIEAASPRQAIRAAHQLGLIDAADVWLELLHDRNRTSHTYISRTAEQVYESAAQLPGLLRSAIDRVRRNYFGGGGTEG
ncbi:HI0074 family nucleotidyltransferase substrate-binding subunit [Deferrisoma palaeochoriense]